MHIIVVSITREIRKEDYIKQCVTSTLSAPEVQALNLQEIEYPEPSPSHPEDNYLPLGTNYFKTGFTFLPIQDRKVSKDTYVCL
jgi:hypothetical protein